jgi:Ca2+-binding RTX toxin-like protein
MTDFYGTSGTDNFVGGGAADSFYFTNGTLSADDRIIGGAGGGDRLTLSGFFAVDLLGIGAYGSTGTIQGIEEIVFTTAFIGALIPVSVVNGAAGVLWVYGSSDGDDLGSTGFSNGPVQTGSMYVFGGDGNDSIRSYFGTGDALFGGVGDDTLSGAGCYMFGGDGNDKFLIEANCVAYGGDGSDTFYATGGVIDGGDGVDSIVLTGSLDASHLVNVENIVLNSPYDFVDSMTMSFSQFGSFTFIGFGSYNTTIKLNLTGNGYYDFAGGIFANAVSVDVSGQTTGVYLSGTTFNDVFHGSDFADYLYGGLGGDVISGGQGADYLSGGDGIDTLNGDDGSDYLYGGLGGDVISGGQGADFVSGDDGNDTLGGDDGSDYLYGGQGDDKVYGGSGADYLFGGDGNDTLYGIIGSDYMAGGAGNDTIATSEFYYANPQLGGTSYASGGDGNDTLIAKGLNDALAGGAGDDVLLSYSIEAAYLFGESGNDYVVGYDGNDYLSGGLGIDVLAGGFGVDYFVGGAGTDYFVMNTDDYYNSYDIISDFTAGVDYIALPTYMQKTAIYVDTAYGVDIYYGDAQGTYQIFVTNTHSIADVRHGVYFTDV